MEIISVLIKRLSNLGLDMTKKQYILTSLLALFLPFLLRGQTAAATEHNAVNNGNKLTGKIFYDQNRNASFDAELLLRGWFVKAENTATRQTYLTTTDASGQYQFNLDAGDYKISVVTPNRYWSPFQQDILAKFDAFDSESKVDFAMKSAAESPAMQVDLKATSFLGCAENTYTVRYANNGTTMATDAFVQLNLDASLSFVDASLPLISQNGQVLRFNIGNISVNEFGSFTIKTKAICTESAVATQNLCSEAHIFPDTLSGLPAVSSGASTVVRGDVGNAQRYSKNHNIIIEDVIIFIMPIRNDNGLDGSNQTDSINIRRTDVNEIVNDSINEIRNRLALQAHQTAYFDSAPQSVYTPSVYLACHALQPANLGGIKQGKNLTVWQPNNLIVYPNPFQTTTTFEIIEQGNTKPQLLIFDMVGKLLREEYFTGNKLLFHRNNLSTGVYIYKIMNGSTPLSTGKLIVAAQ
jgi:uncharacterized repeat protein (TIGR01451 family)